MRFDRLHLAITIKPSIMKKNFFSLLLMALAVFSISCKKDISSLQTSSIAVTGHAKDGVIPYNFNWETVDFMPTPPGQGQIPPPWIGQGSISSVYGIDVINDIKAVDGWQLVYNTFDPNAPGPITDPYFMLYNKYRGLLRVYMYLTGNFTQTSNNLVDGISLVPGSPNSQMFAFAGNQFVDLTQPHQSFSQVEKAPMDGSAPLASNKWYMLQYEIAYDPALSGTPFNNIQLSWFTNFVAISQYSLGGIEEGTLNGTITSSTNGLNSALQNAGKVGGTVALSAVGASVLNNAAGTYTGSTPTYDANGNVNGSTTTTSNNNLGIPNALFTDVQKGLNAGLQAAAGNIPGAIAGIFSAMFGGTSTTTQTVALNLNSTLTITGTASGQGSFPGSPTSAWVPGTQGLTPANQANIQGYIPLYGNVMGVFNLSSAPTCTQTRSQRSFGSGLNTTWINTITYNLNTSSFTFIPNPAVINSNPDGATITGYTQEMVAQPILAANGNTLGIGSSGTMETQGAATFFTLKGNSIAVNYAGSNRTLYPGGNTYVRISFFVTPNNNPTARVKISKTFVCLQQ
jgi:hypothetical protein